MKIGNRNMNIIAPLIGHAELRPDLEKFQPVCAVEQPKFDNPHAVLIERGDTWFAQGFDAYGAAQMAQFMSGAILHGRPLEILASHTEEQLQQFQSRQAEQGEI
jgi:hypothetical protein